MALSRDEIYSKVQSVLEDALGVDADEVSPKATLSGDLGAESIDYLDIVFRLEKAFTTDPANPFKIPRGELFPEDFESLRGDPSLISGDKLTAKGIGELKKRLPYADYSEFEANPTLEAANNLMTVNTIVNYIEAKLK
jgi:acyl carrier protein